MAFERLSALSPVRRLAVGLFLLLLVGFYLLAQVQLVAVVGTGATYPGADAVLARYHGDRKHSRLDKVLDPTLAPDDARNMYQYLGPGDEARPVQRKALLEWVEKGMPRSDWDRVREVFTRPETCGACHAPGAKKADLPFDTYEHVYENVGVDRGMTIQELSTSSHNHLVGFAVVGLVTSMLFTATRWRGPLAVALVVGVFLGAALDVSSWWLTHAYGAPFQYLVMAAGGTFGACLMAMIVLTLDEVWLGGRALGWLAGPLGRLRLLRREAA